MTGKNCPVERFKPIQSFELKKRRRTLILKMRNMQEDLLAFLMEEDGVGVIEVVLILVVLIGLVIVFKGQINKLLDDIFKEINSQSKEVY